MDLSTQGQRRVAAWITPVPDGIPPAWRYDGAIPGGFILYIHVLADEDDVMAEVLGDDLAEWHYQWEGTSLDGDWHVYTLLHQSHLYPAST